MYLVNWFFCLLSVNVLFACLLGKTRINIIQLISLISAVLESLDEFGKVQLIISCENWCLAWVTSQSFKGWKVRWYSVDHNESFCTNLFALLSIDFVYLARFINGRYLVSILQDIQWCWPCIFPVHPSYVTSWHWLSISLFCSGYWIRSQVATGVASAKLLSAMLRWYHT